MSFQLVLSTCSSREDAARLARTLVEEQLAACVNIVPGVESIYRWEGAMQHEQETLLLIKTDTGHLRRLRDRVQELHTYAVPEVIALEIGGGSDAYLDWLQAQLD